MLVAVGEVIFVRFFTSKEFSSNCERTVICLSAAVVGCIYYLIMATHENLHVSYMLVGALLTGSSGGFATIIMSSYRYLQFNAYTTNFVS